MTDTKHEHPWDKMIDSGMGWTDQLVTQWDGKAAYVTRNIDSPEDRVEHVRIILPDGSRLYLGIDASEPVERATTCDCPDPWALNPDVPECPHMHWTAAPETDAEKAWGEWIKALYDTASIKEVDTDL